MAAFKCPGQDMQFWKPEDVVEHPCPHCGAAVEFWRDDTARPCPKCKKRVRNPCFNAGCAEWCKHADKCSTVAATAVQEAAARKPPGTKARQ